MPFPAWLSCWWLELASVQLMSVWWQPTSILRVCPMYRGTHAGPAAL